MRGALEPPSAPDPFWAAVHRRHPDVDLVVLPPDAAVVVDDDAEPAGVLETVAAAADALWSTAVPESSLTPTSRWTYGPNPGLVRAEARLAERRPDGLPALVTLRHELEAGGWAVRRPEGPVERLLAAREGLELTASYAEESGALLLTVSSTALAVGPDRARELVRGGGR